MLYATSLSIVLFFSQFVWAQDMEIPEEMTAAVVDATRSIKSISSQRERIQALKNLNKYLTLSYKKNNGLDAKSYGAHYFYVVLRPVLQMKSASKCKEVEHSVRRNDNGPINSRGQQEVLPETQLALDLLDSLCFNED